MSPAFMKYIVMSEYMHNEKIIEKYMFLAKIHLYNTRDCDIINKGGI